MAGVSLGALPVPGLGAPSAHRRGSKHVPAARVLAHHEISRSAKSLGTADKPSVAFVPCRAQSRLSLRLTKTHRSVTTFGALADPEPEPPKATAFTGNDETDGEAAATDFDEVDSGIVVSQLERSAFHATDESVEALGKLALVEAAARAEAEAARPRPSPPSRTVIVGGGPAGLATAIALARRGWENIEVWERLMAPPSADDLNVWGDPARSYNVGISGRGQIALASLGVIDQVLEYCARVNGRMDWTPGGGAEGTIRITDKKYATQVIQRDRLVAVLLREVLEKYGRQVTVRHNTKCASVEWRVGGGATLTREPVEFDDTKTDDDGKHKSPVRVVEPFVPFVVGAEGAGLKNAVLAAMDSDPDKKCATKIKRFVDKNPRVYKTIPINLPKDKFRNDLNYSARTSGEVALECLPTKEGMLVGILLVKPGDVATCAKLESLGTARAYFNTEFPMFAPYVTDTDLDAMTKRRLSTLPTFAHCGGKQIHRVDTGSVTSNKNKRLDSALPETEPGGAVVLGDSIHCVKPYFGLGVNSAFEDVAVLNTCFDDVGKKEDVIGGAKLAIRILSRLIFPNNYPLIFSLACPPFIEFDDDVGDGKKNPNAWQNALPLFSQRRAADSKALVDISRGLDGGFLTFVLPLIVDGFFHKAFPKLFSPNTIAMLQKEDWTFTRIQRRKRIERVAQAGILAAVFSGVVWVLVRAAVAVAAKIATLAV